MKLQLKFVLWLVPALVGVYAISQVVQQLHSRQLLNELSRTNLGHIDHLAQENAETLEISLIASVRKAMKEGNMNEVQKIMTDQREVRQLVEFSIADSRGVVVYSSDAANIKRKLPVELQSELLSRPEKVMRQTNETVEIYQPLVARAECLDCHTKWKKDAIGGVGYVRLSTAEASIARMEWNNSMHQLERDNQFGGIFTFCCLAVIMSGLSLGVVRLLVVRPFTRLSNAMLDIAQGDGDLTRRLKVDGDDETTTMSQAFNHFVGRIHDTVRTISAHRSRSSEPPPVNFRPSPPKLNKS